MTVLEEGTNKPTPQVSAALILYLPRGTILHNLEIRPTPLEDPFILIQAQQLGWIFADHDVDLFPGNPLVHQPEDEHP